MFGTDCSRELCSSGSAFSTGRPLGTSYAVGTSRPLDACTAGLLVLFVLPDGASAGLHERFVLNASCYGAGWDNN